MTKRPSTWRSVTCSQRRGFCSRQSLSFVGEWFIHCKKLVSACWQSMFRRSQRVADWRHRLACRWIRVVARWKSSFLVRRASLFVGDASLVEDSASLLEDNASFLEINASLFEDNERLFVGDASLLVDNASFSLGRAAVVPFRARFVEVRAALGEIEAAPARVRVTLRRARVAFAKRNDMPEEGNGSTRSTLGAPIYLSAQRAISFEEGGPRAAINGHSRAGHGTPDPCGSSAAPPNSRAPVA